MSLPTSKTPTTQTTQLTASPTQQPTSPIQPQSATLSPPSSTSAVLGSSPPKGGVSLSSATASSASVNPRRPALSTNNSTSSRRSFLGKVPRPRITLRKFNRSSTLEDGTGPQLGLLVVQVLAGRNLVAKDRNGLSDPFLNIRYGNTRVQSPTISKTLNPEWTAGKSGEAKLEAKVHEGSRALGRQPVEILIWDRDRVGKEYLGEMSLGLHQFWGPRESWSAEGGEPPIGFADEGNEPIWHKVRSSRARSQVSGELLVKVGFVSVQEKSKLAGEAAKPQLTEPDRAKLLVMLRRVAEEAEGSRRASKEERVLLSSPTEGVGMNPISDVSPLGETPALLSLEDALSESSESESEDDGQGEETDSEPTTSSEEDENDQAIAETSTDDEAVRLHEGEVAADYFGLAPTLPPISTSVGAPSTGSKPLSPVIEPPVTGAAAPIAVPDIVVAAEDSPAGTPTGLAEAAAAIAPASAIPPHRRGLSLPGFLRRNSSNRSTASSANVSTSDLGEYSADSASTTTGTAGGKKQKPSRRRFSRKKSYPDPNSVDAEGGSDAPVVSKPSKLEKKQRRKHRTESGKSDASNGAEAKPKRKRLGRRKTSAFTYEDDSDDVFGLVQIEINRATLPRAPNMLKTGFDCDPFVVASFGRKVFRTRVIRHNLSPVWDERLYFQVGKLETNWDIAFNVYDWDKLTSNDHVGDVTLPLRDLLGSTIKADERGLYPCDAEGKLIGDGFKDHALKLVVNDKAPAGEYTLSLRAKFTPYDALRQSFWRTLSRQFDLDESGAFSPLEVFSVLDALGSTLTKETVDSFYERFDKTPEDELTADELVICLEAEVHKTRAEKRNVNESALSTPSGLHTPSSDTALLGLLSGEVGHAQAKPQSDEPAEYEPTDNSSNMRTLQPGTAVVTNPEQGTVVEATKESQAPPASRPPAPSRKPTQGSISEDGPSSAEEGVERLVNIKECPLCHRPRLNSRAELDIITHLAICSSTDPRSVNRMVVSHSFVTSAHAQRKWLTKVVSNITKGSYQLGANSANIIVQDRVTGMLQEEKMAVYVRLGIRLMYKGMGASGGMEGQRIRRMLEAMSIKQGKKYDAPQSAREIEPFIRFHNLNLDEVLDPLESFKTFNQFFYRKLRPDARPVSDPDDPKTLVSPADCRAMFFESVQEATKIWIKGREFSVGRLLGEAFKDKAHEYENGSLCIFRLAPQDYHRYHSPVDGVVGPAHKIAGKYYTVNPMAIRSAIDVYGENVRLVGSILSPEFGEVMNCWIGAMMVGSICQTVKEGQEIKRADETGYFAFGGSTIVVLFKPGKVKFDDDLVNNSKASLETLVRMGSRIGRAVA